MWQVLIDIAVQVTATILAALILSLVDKKYTKPCESWSQCHSHRVKLNSGRVVPWGGVRAPPFFYAKSDPSVNEPCKKLPASLNFDWGRSSAKEVMPMVQILLDIVINMIGNVLAALVLKYFERKK